MEVVYQYLVEGRIYAYVEQLLNIRCGLKMVEGTSCIKICPECIKKQKYLKREHQIPGNFICIDHEKELVFFEYQKKALSLNNWADGLMANSYNLTSEERNKAIVIAGMVHDIFKHGFKVNITNLKQIIRSKLRALDYLDADYSFYDFSCFKKQFGNDLYFRSTDKDLELFNAIYDVHKGTNPIYYLLFIEFLFGSLEALYEYEIEFKHGTISRNRQRLNWNNAESFDIDHYHEIMGNEYFEEYVIRGDTENSIVIYHKNCGGYFCVDKNCNRLSKCIYCIEKIRLRKHYKDAVNMSGGYKHYLNTIEYARLHGKERRQIYKYCEEGRIEGAVKVTDYWLIPEDSPYPKDLRRK